MKINDAKIGTVIRLDGKPMRILKINHSHTGRGKASVEILLRHISTGQNLRHTVKSDATIEELEVETTELSFMYRKGELLYFLDADNNKIELVNPISNRANFLLKGMRVKGVIDEKIISLELPIKATYEVVEAPPGIKGDTAQGGSKVVTLNSGALVKVPLFINQGDQIIVNTETGEYAERSK